MYDYYYFYFIYQLRIYMIIAVILSHPTSSDVCLATKKSSKSSIIFFESFFDFLSSLI